MSQRIQNWLKASLEDNVSDKAVGITEIEGDVTTVPAGEKTVDADISVKKDDLEVADPAISLPDSDDQVKVKVAQENLETVLVTDAAQTVEPTLVLVEDNVRPDAPVPVTEPLADANVAPVVDDVPQADGTTVETAPVTGEPITVAIEDEEGKVTAKINIVEGNEPPEVPTGDDLPAPGEKATVEVTKGS